MGSGDPLGADHPERCCDGLTAYTRGGSEWLMGEGCVKKNHSTVPTGYRCIKCGDSICNRDGGEDLCSCPQDCVAEGQLGCNTSSDCLIGIDLSHCCACPWAYQKSMVDGKNIVVYEKDVNYSITNFPKCGDIFCYPCRPASEAICHSGKCIEASLCGNAFCEIGEDESSCPADCLM